MLELELAGGREEHVDDDALRGGEQDLADDRFVLVVARVGPDELHLRARQHHVEDARVGRVREVQTDHLAAFRLEHEVRLA